MDGSDSEAIEPITIFIVEESSERDSGDYIAMKTPSRSLKRILKTILRLVLALCIIVCILLVIYFVYVYFFYESTYENDWVEPEIPAEFGPAFEPAQCMFTEEESWDYWYLPEEAGFICGYVQVPLWHDQPDEAMIRIPVVVIKAEDFYNRTDGIIQPDPVFLTQGGPGGSALDLYPSMLISATFGLDRDYVIIDQRGTRYAEPSLVCPEEREAWLDAEEEGSDEAEDEDENGAIWACHDRLVTEGVDLSAFNTRQIAADIDAVRQALGYEQINFYGVSYGTQIGQYLMAYYPETLRTVILDGVSTLPLDYLNKSLGVHHRVLEQFFDGCMTDPDCRSDYPDLELRFERFLAELDRQPATITFQDPYSQDSLTDEMEGPYFLTLVLGSFYFDKAYAILPFLIDQAEHGKYDFFKSLGEYVLFEETMSSGLFNSVICAEHATFEVDSNLKESVPVWLADMEDGGSEDNHQDCVIWNVEVPQDRLDEPIRSDVPTLLLSGHYDPATPPENGDKVLAGLTRGYHIIDPVGSHGIAFSDGCTQGIVGDFLSNPKKEPDSSCLEDPTRRLQVIPPGAIPMKYMSKMVLTEWMLYGPALLSGGILLILVLAGVITFMKHIWRGIRRRREILFARERWLRGLYTLPLFTIAVGVFSHAFGILLMIFRIGSENPAYLYAFAFPGEARSLLMLPLPLILVVPELLAVGFFLFQMPGLPRREKRDVVLVCLYALGYTGFLGWAGLLTAGL